MNRSEQNPISDELLSAYIDGAVSNEEKEIVEAAILADPALAWELESLRRTVALVQALPPLALPRSFALREDQVADVLAERRARAIAPVAVRSPRQPVAPPRRSVWQDFLAFFNSGNLLLRNATAVAAILFVVVLVTSPGANQSSNPLLTSAPSAMQLPMESPAQADSHSEPALPAMEESAGVAGEAAGEGAAPAEAQAEMAPAAQSVAPVAEMAPVVQSDASVSDAAAPMAKAASVPADAPPSGAAAMNEAPPGMDSGASSAAMRAGPAGGEAPAARMMPGASGGALESGPALFQAGPADFVGNGARSADGALPANGEIVQPMNVEPETSPLVEPMAKIAMDSAADEPEVAASPETVAIQSAPAELSDASVAQESQASAVSAEMDSAPLPVATGLLWSNWGWLQAAAGGLALLLGALWLYTRRV